MNNANTVRYPGHTLWHLRASQQWGAFTLWARVSNLTDARYAESASSSYSGIGTYTPRSMDSYTPGAPRALWLGLDTRF
jgi:outer membrane receptor protein involved in Fe transport